MIEQRGARNGRDELLDDLRGTSMSFYRIFDETFGNLWIMTECLN